MRVSLYKYASGRVGVRVRQALLLACPQVSYFSTSVVLLVNKLHVADGISSKDERREDFVTVISRKL